MYKGRHNGMCVRAWRAVSTGLSKRNFIPGNCSGSYSEFSFSSVSRARRSMLLKKQKYKPYLLPSPNHPHPLSYLSVNATSALAPTPGKGSGGWRKSKQESGEGRENGTANLWVAERHGIAKLLNLGGQ